MHRFEPRTRLCNGLDVRHPKGGLDEHLDSYLVLDTHGLLDLAQHRVDHVDVAWHADLGYENGVDVVACLLDNVDEISIHVVRVEAVDPDRDGFC